MDMPTAQAENHADDFESRFFRMEFVSEEQAIDRGVDRSTNRK